MPLKTRFVRPAGLGLGIRSVGLELGIRRCDARDA
jgi:hypothetical protein